MTAAPPVHVVVVGGGISGLAAAYRLRRLLGAGARITVVEQAAVLGGKLRTVPLAGAPYDVGSEAFLVRRPEALALVRELGLADGLAALGVPRIHFGVGTGELLGLIGEAGAEVVGVDWRVPLDEARERVGPGVAVQGNLDPALCLAPWPAVEERVRDVLARNAGRPGHIFNLGHGVLPGTDPEILERVVEVVHREGLSG